MRGVGVPASDRAGVWGGAPREFVEEEFRAFLRCGWLAGGFARFRCTSCGLDRLVAFSCKGRGFCPSCGGRRMTERAAHLVDAVFPDVPVRQWVLTLPPRFRYQLAWNHDLCRAVVGVYLRAVLGALRGRARRGGVVDGRGGAVAAVRIVQRFGGASISTYTCTRWSSTASSRRTAPGWCAFIPPAA